MTTTKSQQPPDKDLTPVIDMVLQRDVDGTSVYVTEREACVTNVAFCLLWAVNHPAEVMRGLVVASSAVVVLYLAYDVFYPPEATSG